MAKFLLVASVALAGRVKASQIDSELAATELDSSLMQLTAKKAEAMDKQVAATACNNIAAGMQTSYNTVAGLHSVSGGTANGITDGLLYADGGWPKCVHTSDWKTDPFVVVDLVSSSTFSEIRLNSGPGYTNGWATGAEIRVSDTPLTSPSDFSAATLCATLPSGFSSANTWFDISCSTTVSGRYVGFIVPGNGKIVMFCEIEVCGGTAPTTTTTTTTTTTAPTPAPSPTGSSCKALRDAGYTTDGTYQISLLDTAGSASTVTTYCDMTNGGWTLVGQISGKHSMYNDWLRTSHNADNLQSLTISPNTWASIPAVDLAVNHASQVRFSNQDLSKYVYWDMDSGRTLATWWNQAAGQSTINSATDNQVTVYDQDGTTSTCWQNAYGAMPLSQHGGSYPSANYNTAGNTVPGDRCMSVGVLPSGSANGFSQNGNSYDAPDSDSDWMNSDYTSPPFVNVWVGGQDAIPTSQAGVPAAGGASGASAVGDPHLQNVHGERFDLMMPGKHVLINIPRGAPAEKAMLRVLADARHLGRQCADMYFREVNVTGSWAEAKKAGGYHFSVKHGDVETPKWVFFGKVGLKIVHGRTGGGVSYLNVYVKHLKRAGVPVGGLLGEDDHEDVITPPPHCDNKMSLIEVVGGEGGRAAPSLRSAAEASFD